MDKKRANNAVDRIRIRARARSRTDGAIDVETRGDRIFAAQDKADGIPLIPEPPRAAAPAPAPAPPAAGNGDGDHYEGCSWEDHKTGKKEQNKN